MKYSDRNIKDSLSKFGSREIIAIQCEQCKEVYKISKHSALRSVNKGVTHSFCSRQCKSIFNEVFIEYTCLGCNKSFMNYAKANSKFCSHSCSASLNNVGVTRNGKPSSDCINCGEKTKRSSSKYCSNNCQQDFNLEKRIASEKFSAQTAKKYLLKHNGNRCSVCDLSEWNELPIPIELDHIDGNSENNCLSNLRLICPNCHAQTDTYKGRNVGKGRHKRRERYRSGKSY